jgi:CheY-like chemotaxis protein
VSRPVILCIDDEDLGLEIRKMVLEREGFCVLTARDGPTGISLFDTEQVDAVVLDYAMPGIDGGEVAAILRKRQPNIPILMLSAYVALPEHVMRGGERLGHQRGRCVHPGRQIERAAAGECSGCTRRSR